MSRSPRRVRACWLDSVPYRDAWDLQAALVADVREGRAPDTLLLLEHPHVFTLGKAAAERDLLWDESQRRRRGVEVVWSDRGGEATYHGPGQLVGYPILDLLRFELTIPGYIGLLEQTLIGYLRGLGIASESGERGFTGVWREGEKLAAIGIKLNGSMVSHGFALNVTTDLTYFDGIVPCGHVERRPTSIEAVSRLKIPSEKAARDYAPLFAEAVQAELDWTPSQEILRVRSASA